MTKKCKVPQIYQIENNKYLFLSLFLSGGLDIHKVILDFYTLDN